MSRAACTSDSGSRRRWLAGRRPQRRNHAARARRGAVSMHRPMNPDGSHRHDLMAEPTITGIITVAVPVSDQDAAVEVFQHLGLQGAPRRRVATPASAGSRWACRPAGADHLARAHRRRPSRRHRHGHPTRDGATTALRPGPSRPGGLTPAICSIGHGGPLMFSFADADGNRFYVAEASELTRPTAASAGDRPIPVDGRLPRWGAAAPRRDGRARDTRRAPTCRTVSGGKGGSLEVSRHTVTCPRALDRPCRRKRAHGCRPCGRSARSPR